MRLIRARRTVLVFAGFVPLSLAAQDGYRQPPAAIARILDAPLTPVVSVSPDRARLVLLERPSMPSIEEVAAPELRLAGIRLNPRTNAPSRLPTYTGLSVLPVTGGTDHRIAVRPGLKISHVSWSPDSRWIAFTSPEGPGLSLWVADPANSPIYAPDGLTGTARRAFNKVFVPYDAAKQNFAPLAARQIELPREDSGKIFKRKLRAPYWEKAGRQI